MNIKVVMVLTIVILAVLLYWIGGDHKGMTNKKWVNFNTDLDSLVIDKPQNRGAWIVYDSLVLSSGIRLFDRNNCDLICKANGCSYKNGMKQCSIFDLDVPFMIFKNSQSDTLHVYKNGVKLIFRIVD